MLSLADLEAVVEDGVRVGATGMAPFPAERDLIVDRVSSGLSGGLGFTYAAPDISTSPLISFPWAASIIVVAVPYLRDGDAEAGSVNRTVARFADGDRYAAIRAALDAIADALMTGGFRAEPVFDDDRLVDRALAIRSGVAWSGKSTMALTPRHGPWILIGSVVTDAPFAQTPAMIRNCGTCTACIPACPTAAIVEPGVLDASRCLAAVLQRPGAIRRDLRKAVGSKVYGCDDCLTACPPGFHTLLNVGDAASQQTPAEILGMPDGEIDHSFSHWYVPKRNMRFIRRNALVALGNMGSEADLGVVAGYLGHPDSLLRQHAAWAAGRIGGSVAAAILEFALTIEVDQLVVDEITSAMSAIGYGAVYDEPSNETQPGSFEIV